MSVHTPLSPPCSRRLTFDPSQSTSPSLRDILAAFKFSKGQDGDCQLLLAVLNAKTAEDQVFCPPARFAHLDTHRAPSSSEQPRSRISTRVCSNLNQTSTFLLLPQRTPSHDCTSHHPSHPLDLIRPILRPPSTAILLMNHRGCRSPR
jgi:hypothetical protein